MIPHRKKFKRIRMFDYKKQLNKNELTRIGN